ncbi:MAG: oligosaccharide repeat unit polymerase [Phycisphaerae bacterium]|nr:oligosaccharide repeat unit polymerase [Phycisphaerae bacterium]
MTTDLFSEPAPAARTSGRILAAVLLLILLGAVLAASVAPRDLSRAFLGICTFTALGILVLQIVHVATGKERANWMSVDILFMLSYLIVHYVYTLFWLLGVAPSENEIWYAQSVVCYSAAVSLAGLAAFGFGFNLPSARYAWPQRGAIWDVATLRRWKVVGLGVFFCGAVSTVIWLMLAGESLDVGGYVHASELPYAARISFLVSEVLLRLGLAVVTVAAGQLTGRWKIGLVPKIGFAVFIGWLLVLGDRSAATGIGVLVLAAYSEYVRRISLKLFVPALLVGIVMLGVVRMTRHAADRSVTSFIETARAQSSEIGWQSTLLNFGGSVMTLHAATHTFPSQQGYYYGKLQVSPVIGIIPFTRQILPPEKGFVTSARVLTELINKPSQKWGRGTTVTADLYCDFGLPGVVIVLFFVGILCKRVQQRARASNSITWAVAHVAIIATMALMPRYAVSGLVRSVLWPVLAVYVVSWIFGLPRNATLAVRPTWWWPAERSRVDIRSTCG